MRSARPPHGAMVSLGLGLLTVGGFDDAQVAAALALPAAKTPLYLLPVGKPMPRE